MSQVTALLEKARTNEQGYCSFLANGEWYGTFKTDYSALEGLIVTFEATQKGNFKNAKNVKPATNGEAAPAAVAAPAPAPAPAQGGMDRQASIVLQSSYKTAAEFLGSLIAADKVALGTKGKAFDSALGLLDETAAHIFRSCINPERFFAGLAPAESAEEEEDDGAAPVGKPWNPTEA